MKHEIIHRIYTDDGMHYVQYDTDTGKVIVDDRSMDRDTAQFLGAIMLDMLDDYRDR